MPLANVPPCPDSLKAIKPFLTTALEHDDRDKVVSYWCRLHAVQQGMKLDRSSPEAKALLIFLMSWLEETKKKEASNEAIIHDIPGQAYLENYALKLFLWADEQDRAAVFNKSVVKSFFTASILYSVMEVFGDLTEEVQRNQKYAKWKASYIHNCLKNGETPVPGPIGGDNERDSMGFVMPGNPGPSSSNVPPTGPSHHPGYPPAPTSPTVYNPPAPTNPTVYNPPAPKDFPAPQPQPQSLPFNIPPASGDESAVGTAVSEGGATLPADLIMKAQKYCKFAGSALTYDDVPTAIINLNKALSILKTGKEE